MSFSKDSRNIYFFKKKRKRGFKGVGLTDDEDGRSPTTSEISLMMSIHVDTQENSSKMKIYWG